MTVVIPCRNGEHELGRQLAALAREPEAPTTEVIVSDNGSTDRTRQVALAYADAFGGMRVVDSGDRAGVSHARNIGIVAARSEKVLICDADDEVHTGWIAALSAGLDDADVVGGSTVAAHDRAAGTPPDDGAGPAERHVLGYLPYVLGACMGVRRSAALAVGGFDESFARGHDEVDFCWRMQQEGYTLKGIPDAVLEYRQRDRARDAARQHFHYARTRILLWTRYHERGELEPVSFSGSIRHAARSLREAPRLLPRASRLDAARTIGWSFGTVSGHLRYRILGSAPDPVRMGPPAPRDA